MKKIFAIVIFVSFLTISETTFSQKTKDKTEYVYESSKGKCKVTFPAKFEVKESTTKKGLKNTMVKASKNGDVFMFNHAIQEKNIQELKPYKYIDDLVLGFANKMKGKIKSERIMKDAKIKLNDKDLYVFYRLFFKKNIQYQFIIITKAKKRNKVMKNFLQSFEYLN